MTIAKYLAVSLKNQKIDTVFGIPSYVGMSLLKEFKENNFDIILNTHEQNAAHAAEGYFYAAKKPAILSVAIGPGLTNAITGISNAYVESIPMIIIAARASNKFRGRNEYHSNTGLGRSIDEYNILKSCTKGVFNIDNTVNVEAVLHDAISTAISDRPGPVVIIVPPEVQIQEINTTPLKKIKYNYGNSNSDAVKEIEAEFNKAEKPIILLGKHIQESDKRYLKKILEDNCPYFTTYGAKGHVPIFENYLGTSWYCNSENIAEAVKEADLVLAIGEEFSAFSIRAFENSNYFNNKKIIQVSEYSDEIGRTFNVDVGYRCEIKNFVENLELSKKTWQVKSQKNYEAKTYNTLYCLQNLPTLLPNDATFFSDVGNAGYASITDMNLQENQTFYTTGKFGVCGWSVGTAIGYSYANTKKLTFSIIGDLSLNMNIQELANIRKLKTKNQIILFNNNSPQNISQDQQEILEYTIQSDMPKIEFNKISEAYGLKYFEITNEVSLKTIKDLDFQNENYLIEIKLDKNDYPLRD